MTRSGPGSPRAEEEPRNLPGTRPPQPHCSPWKGSQKRACRSWQPFYPPATATMRRARRKRGGTDPPIRAQRTHRSGSRMTSAAPADLSSVHRADGDADVSVRSACQSHSLAPVACPGHVLRRPALSRRRSSSGPRPRGPVRADDRIGLRSPGEPVRTCCHGRSQCAARITAVQTLNSAVTPATALTPATAVAR